MANSGEGNEVVDSLGSLPLYDGLLTGEEAPIIDVTTPPKAVDSPGIAEVVHASDTGREDSSEGLFKQKPPWFEERYIPPPGYGEARRKLKRDYLARAEAEKNILGGQSAGKDSSLHDSPSNRPSDGHTVSNDVPRSDSADKSEETSVVANVEKPAEVRPRKKGRLMDLHPVEVAEILLMRAEKAQQAEASKSMSKEGGTS